MAGASSLHGLMTFLNRRVWRGNFETATLGHIFVACRKAGIASLEIETPDEARARQRRRPAASDEASDRVIPPDEKLRIVHADLDAHCHRMLDRELGILDASTPRQAALTAPGRNKAARWLEPIEWEAHRRCGADDPLASYDPTWMWSAPGMAQWRV